MGALLAKENIWYVGTQDPNLRVFDIIMHSDWGTSYNPYLVKGSEKTALFETSKLEFFDEFLANVREVCDPASIDYIVVDHTEPDHSGSLEKLLALAPNATVLGSATALFEADCEPRVCLPRRDGKGYGRPWRHDAAFPQRAVSALAGQHVHLYSRSQGAVHL